MSTVKSHIRIVRGKMIKVKGHERKSSIIQSRDNDLHSYIRMGKVTTDKLGLSDIWQKKHQKLERETKDFWKK